MCSLIPLSITLKLLESTCIFDVLVLLLEITFPSNNNSNFVLLRRILGQIQFPEIPILLTILTQNTIILLLAFLLPHHLLPLLTQSCILKPEYRPLRPTDNPTAIILSLPHPPPVVVYPIPLSGRTIPPLSTSSPRNPLLTPRPSVSSRLITRIIPSLRSAIANPITTHMHQIRIIVHPILTIVHQILIIVHQILIIVHQILIIVHQIRVIVHPILTTVHQIRTAAHPNPPITLPMPATHPPNPPIRTRLPAATAPSPAGSPARRGSKWSRRTSSRSAASSTRRCVSTRSSARSIR